MTGSTAEPQEWPKFDVVIGNPPYQDESRGDATSMPPIYHLFMDAAFEIGKQAVIITPARFLSNAGSTPKAWNTKMLADEHLTVAHFEPDSAALFPDLSDTIKGGIAVTHRDSDRTLGPIGTFTKYDEMNDILRKVEATGPVSIMEVTINRSSHTYNKLLFNEHPDAAIRIGHSNLSQILPNAFDVLEHWFHAQKPDDGHDYVRVFGLSQRRRQYRWIRRDYLALHPSAWKWKIAIPKANGTGSTTNFFGIRLTNPEVLAPGSIVTNTFITIGSFDTEVEARACLKYLKSKFARCMLGVLQVTQDTARPVWKYVPLQDFTSASDIDWAKSIHEIDRQLYAKYGLDVGEIAFIESHVKEMK